MKSKDKNTEMTKPKSPRAELKSKMEQEKGHIYKIKAKLILEELSPSQKFKAHTKKAQHEANLERYKADLAELQLEEYKRKIGKK